MSWDSNSVSQTKTAQECPRLWYGSKFLGWDDPQAPAAYRGDSMHSAIHYFLTRRGICRSNADHNSEYPIEEYAPYVEALQLRGFLPEGRAGEDYLVEHWFTCEAAHGPPYRGKIDLADRAPDGLPRITDWKGSGDLRRALKPWQMRKDPQCVLYALSAEADEVWVRLVYVEIQPRIDRAKRDAMIVEGLVDEAERLERLPKPPRGGADKIKIVPVPVKFTRAEAESAWSALEIVQMNMLEWSSAGRWQDVPGDPARERCHKYGKTCVNAVECGVQPRQIGKKEASGMGWADKFKKSDPAGPASRGEVPPGQPDALGTSVTPGPAGTVHVKLGGPDGQGVTLPADHPAVKQMTAPGSPWDDKNHPAWRAGEQSIVPPDAPARDAYKSAGPLAPPPLQAERKPRASTRKRDRVQVPEAEAGPAPAPTTPAGQPDGSWTAQAEEVETGRLSTKDAGPPRELVDALKSKVADGLAVGGPAAAQARQEVAAAGGADLSWTTASVGPVVLIDCYPIKGAPDYVASFEDWIGPAIDELNRDVEARDKLPHWRLLDYGNSHAAIELAVTEHIRRVGLPPVMHVPSSHPLARDVLHKIERAAALVIRRMG